VRHSLSAAMHNAAFQSLGINAEYRLFEIRPAALNAFLQGDLEVSDIEGKSVRSGDIAGFNVTIPHKVPVFAQAHTAHVDPLALLCGAVNTVKREGERLLYRNTDCTGFITSLRQDLQFDTAGKTVVVIGCGGAGRAVIAGLAQSGTGVKKIYISDLNLLVAEATLEHFSAFADLEVTPELISLQEVAGKIQEADLLVNASPVGMKEGEEPAVEKEWLHPRLSVYDVVYNRTTELLRESRSLGIPSYGGSGMLLYQGVHAFEIWFGGQKAPVEVMRRVLLDSLQ
ncbi:MAG: shikimate dehydrogenase, partial [Candidatus Omnitrophica bacterium]|nr:shikimate dehydrogenase [Candidatus Omnitrophota bacterium]